MTVSKVRRTSKSSEGGGGTVAAAAPTGSGIASRAGPVEEEGGAELEGSDLACLEPARR